jgi:hypothetical protein
MRSMRHTPPATIISTPLKIIASVYPPLSCDMRAPAIGVPVNVAKLITLELIGPRGAHLNNIPILTPILFISSGLVRDTTHAGGRLTNVPEKNPYKQANATNPCHVDAPNHPNMSTAAATIVARRTLIGPITSATKFGSIRPNTDAAYVNAIKRGLHSSWEEHRGPNLLEY